MDITPNTPDKRQIAAQYSAGALAYLGDAVMEVLVRTMLVRRGIGNSGKLSALSLDYVRATAQSKGLNGVLPHLTEEEEVVYHRGRNGAGAHPKSASVAQYRRATGFEALIGYLHLCGEQQRLEELFAYYTEYLDTHQGDDDHADEEK